MVNRFIAPLGSALTLVGALVIGAVLHQTVVLTDNNVGLTSPFGVFGLVGGVAIVYLGVRLEKQFDPSEYVPDQPDEDEDEEEFDEEMSPISEEALEGRDADESYDG